MTHPIIKSDNYLLVVDDSNYYDEYYLNKIDMQIYKRDGGGDIPTEGGVWHKKITFHLPLNNAPILEGVPLLPPLEDEIIQSLQQSKYPVAVDCDVEGYKVNGMIDEATVYKPKTITNSQGLTQLVGKYIY
jgi:hypothetical protein